MLRPFFDDFGSKLTKADSCNKEEVRSQVPHFFRSHPHLGTRKILRMPRTLRNNFRTCPNFEHFFTKVFENRTLVFGR